MDRRTFIGGAALAMFGPPLAAATREGSKRVIGFLSLASADASVPLVAAFEAGLRDLGYVEGRTITLERRYADGLPERLPALAAELARLPVDVIVAGANPTITAAKRATSTIPIVMVHAVDPVENDLVASLARPGGNVTGLSIGAGGEIGGKRLAMLKQFVPTLSRVAILKQTESGVDEALYKPAAQRLGVTLNVIEIGRPDQIEEAFAAIKRGRAEAILVSGGPVTYMTRHRIAELAIANRLPAIHSLRDYADAGFLASYGPNLPGLYRRAAGYVDRILKGAKPATLPVERPAEFEFVINARTAQALGVKIPQSLQSQADEVIR